MRTLWNEKDSLGEKYYVKIKCIGISNHKFRNQYTFEISQHFFGFLRQFLFNLGFKKDLESIGRPQFS